MCKSYEWGKTNNEGRQKLKGWFYDDGNLYILSEILFKREMVWIAKKNSAGIPMELEIDDENDLKFLNSSYKTKNNFFLKIHSLVFINDNNFQI